MKYSTYYKTGRSESHYEGNLDWMSFSVTDRDKYIIKISNSEKEDQREFSEIIRFTITEKFMVDMILADNENIKKKAYALKYNNKTEIFAIYYDMPSYVDEEHTELSPADQTVELSQIIQFKIYRMN